MKKLILFVVLIVVVSCSNGTKELTIWQDGKKVTLKLASHHHFTQVGSLWKENDISEYYGKWRYIDEKNHIIETTIHGIVGGPDWTETRKYTYRLEGVN